MCDVLSYGVTVLTHCLRKHFLPTRVLLLVQATAPLPVGETPNTNLLIFGSPSQRLQKSQQLIRLAAATLGVPLTSA